jgi:uncharacterized membrane protein
MTEAIERFFLETVGRELCVFFCSMLPIIECRGAIPLGWGLGLPWWQTVLFSLAGNLLPVPFLLLFIRAVLSWMRGSRVKFFANIAAWLDRKIEKHKGTIEKYSYWGVVIFVAIPLPGTGAWTGTLIASVLGLDAKKCFFAAALGVLIATAIMTVVSYLGLNFIFH